MKNARSISITAGIFVLFHFGDVLAQTDSSRILCDSLSSDSLSILEYQIPFRPDAEYYGMQYEVFLAGHNIVTTKIWPFTHVYPCTIGDTPCTFDDLNGDGVRDIVFEFLSGGNNGAEDIVIYTLDSTGNSWASFEGLDKIFGGFEDIDQDSLPEIIFYDLAFDCWPEGCSGAPRPILIWKWDGHRYRLSNLKFRDYVLRIRGWKDMPDNKQTARSWVKNFYSKPGYGSFPWVIAHVMIEYIYAGEFAKADSTFNELWIPEVDDRDKRHDEIWEMARSGPYWNMLLESDW